MGTVWPERRSVEKCLGSRWAQVTPTSPGDLAAEVASGGSLGVLGHAGCAGQRFPNSSALLRLDLGTRSSLGLPVQQTVTGWRCWSLGCVGFITKLSTLMHTSTRCIASTPPPLNMLCWWLWLLTSAVICSPWGIHRSWQSLWHQDWCGVDHPGGISGVPGLLSPEGAAILLSKWSLARFLVYTRILSGWLSHIYVTFMRQRHLWLKCLLCPQWL